MTQTQKQKEIPAISEASRKDLTSLRDMSQAMRQSKDPDYFEQQLTYVEEGARAVLIASMDGVDAGYCILNWQPKYGFFKANNIPEIQDLNVLRDFRRRGIATHIIGRCEAMAVKKGYGTMGISFGLDASYGAAQRLYVKLGYIPDGHGVTYDRRAVPFGEFKPVDDQLCLMMVKIL
ncbi:MAG: GNAT family N-acetyltransferase [Alphaproteobacteria bacterium]